MNHLLRDNAPITDAGWALLDREAAGRLTVALGARRLVDFSGPFGWSYSATNLGRVGPPVAAPADSVVARARQVQPLAEVRAEFAVRRDELDAYERGAVDLDLDALDAAALSIAAVENAAVFHGWEALGIRGITDASPHAAMPYEAQPARFAEQIASAVATLKRSGIGGPYGLAVAPNDWVEIIEASEQGGYPLLKHLPRILGGPIEWVPGITGGVVLSMRGNDFLFESGEDLSIGYSSHTLDSVDLYLEETFSFRVATPEAAIALGIA